MSARRAASVRKQRPVMELSEERKGGAGGVLASLNVNINMPVGRVRQGKENSGLPSSVVVSTTPRLSACSLNERLRRNDNVSLQSFDKDVDDDLSAVSCDFSPRTLIDQSLAQHPKNQGRTVDSPRLNSGYENHNLTGLELSENETSEDSSSFSDFRELEVATVDSSTVNEKDSESEASESTLECYDAQFDDDEYDPDEDEDSNAEDDLELTEVDIEQSPEFKTMPSRSKRGEKSKGHVDINPNKADCSVKFALSTQTTDSDDDSTVVEHTPPPKSTKKSFLDTSPEFQLAEVVNDEEVLDDDILVATIIDEEQKVENKESSENVLSNVSLLGSIGENDRMDHVDGAISQRAINQKQNAPVIKTKDSIKIRRGDETNELNPFDGGQQEAVESYCTISVERILYQTPTQKKSRGRKTSFYRQEGRVKRGKWTLGAKIGVGSFGVVHIGMNTLNGSLMAVKVFKVDEAVTKDVRREVELMRMLRHQNIVQYLGAQMDKTNLYIFQEWVPGGSVASMLSRFGNFPLQVIQRYLSQALLGLQYLHENGIIHRDIKGSNILINDEGVVKLADFGASKKLANMQGDLMMSLTVRGTPYFMAPEVFEEKYSSKADLWGIGCVAYQMITASPPWKDQGFTNPISLFNHIKRTSGPPDLPRSATASILKEDPELKYAFDMLLKECFEKDPSSRPSAQELLAHEFFRVIVTPTADDDSIYDRLFSPGSQMPSPWSVIRNQAGDNLSPLHSRLLKSPHRDPKKHVAASTGTRQAQKVPSTLSEIDGYRNQSNIFSPQRDTSDWPEWAKDQFGKEEHRSPLEDKALSNMMGSLALSEDSTRQNPFATSLDNSSALAENSVFSNLLGLQLIDGKGAKDYP